MQAAITDNNAHETGGNPVYYLAPHVCACELPEGAVFLDLLSSTYFAVDGRCLPLLRRMIGNWRQNGSLTLNGILIDPQDGQLIGALRTRGFIVSTNSPRAFSAISSQPAAACTPNWNLRATLRATVVMLYRICSSYATTIALLRSRHLAMLLRRLDRPRPVQRLSSVSQFELQSVVSLFAKLRLWFYTARDNCLLDSLVLTSVLRRYHINAILHIGVALMPFSAHAWVQMDCCVLDDSVDHVRSYTPIVVV